MLNLKASAARVCIVTETYQPEINGVANTMAKFVEGLTALGYRVSLILPKLSRRSLHRSAPIAHEELRVRGFPLPFYRDLRFGLPAWGCLRREFEKQRPAIVYIATQGPLGISALRAAKHLGIPVVTGFHTNFHMYLKHYGLPILSRVARCYLRWFHNASDQTIVPTVDLVDMLNEIGIDNSYVIPRGVDSDQFSPEHRCAELRRSWGADDKTTVVIHVGRLAVEKNIDLAIASYLELRQRVKNSKFVIVGDGPMRDELQKKYQDSDFIFGGFKTGRDLARFYASADLFLFPSETETFGNVVLEALASGLGVVAYRYAAAKMHIDHLQSGILAPFSNSRAFMEQAAAIATDPLRLQYIRMKARQTAVDISWQNVISRLENVFKMNLMHTEPIARPRVAAVGSHSISPLTR
jgi:glycosyltransferase involved in cell wall biosynthesis